MNVLHLARTMDQGGAEKIIYQLARGSREHGDKVCVISSGGVYEEKLENHGIHHYKVYDLECKNPKIMQQTLRELIAVVKKEKIEIIHTHHRMAALYARIVKIFFPHIRLVYTAHNVFYNKKWLTKVSLAGSNVVAVGECVKKNLTDVFGINEKKITTIYNAVQIESAKEENYNKTLKELQEKEYILAGVIGRLSEQKGIDVFIHAIAGLHEQIPQLKGIIIGDGEDKEQLQSLVRELKMEEYILFLGYQEHITTLIRQLDFVVMPSRWEGFPLTPIEVFAMKKTIIASDIDGINEIVRDKKNGILVEKDDVSAFSNAMESLMTDHNLKEQLENNGRYYYEEHFDYDSFIKQYHLLYQKILSKG